MTSRLRFLGLPAGIIFALVTTFLLIESGGVAYSQGTNIKFGQNRVQYHDFDWSYYQSENFVTYFYLGGQDIGKFTVQVAEKEIKEIEQLLDYKLNNRIEILVYNDLADLNQSNIGIGLDLLNTGGITKILGNKMFVYFDGNHQHLLEQIREGIANIFISYMMFGGNIQEVLQNAVLLNLPKWFIEGLVVYVGEDWSTKLDDRLRDGFLSGKYKKFSNLTDNDAKLAGHSFWYYVAQNYGKEAIPNLLYLTRINRSLENGFLFVLGFTYKQAIDEWYRFYYDRYTSELKTSIQPPDSLLVKKRYRKSRIYGNVKLSRDGKHIAYVSHNLGAYRVHLLNTAENDEKVILRGGFKTKSLVIDHNYPLLAFDPTGRKLVVVHEKRDVIQIMVYDLIENKEEVRDIIKFQRITNIAFTDDPRRMVFSAMNRGQSDIYYFNVKSKTISQITNDFYDDLMPAYVDLGHWKGVVFASNRRDDTLRKERLDTVAPIENYDIYLYDEKSEDKKVLINLTNTPYLNEKFPGQIDSVRFAFLSDLNGIQNRYAGYLDSIYKGDKYTIFYKDSIKEHGPTEDVQMILSRDAAVIDSFQKASVYKDTAYFFPITDNTRNIQGHDINYRIGKVVDLVHYNDRYEFVLDRTPRNLDSPTIPLLKSTFYRDKTIEEWGIKTSKIEEKPQIPVIPDPGFLFQNEFSGDSILTFEDLDKDDPSYRPTRVLPYRVKFSTDYVLSQLDNTLIIDQYQNFIGNGPVYQAQPLSGLIAISLSDLMEDHRIMGGFRFPTTFDGSEYFLAYENLKKRLDKRFLYYRRSNFQTYDFTPIHFPEVNARQKTNYWEASARYPFDVLRSLRGALAYRNYKIVFLGTDQFTLDLPNYTEHWLTAKFEYVFDNTYQVDLNILNGTRYKVYYEAHKQFDLNVDPGFDLDLNQGFMSVLGLDFRHYQKVHKNIIWATRFAAATSFGSKKLIYYLGGVDNWLGAKFNNDIDVNLNNNYAFQTIATNLRGFKQNIRNGNSYAVINTELRVPIFAYLINAPIKSELIRNFQVVAFGDIGTAWEGTSPFDQDNPFNSETVQNGPVNVLVRYFRNPIVGGYGFGARTLLFGYFVRGDVAWGVDSGVINDPIWYFSLSLDF